MIKMTLLNLKKFSFLGKLIISTTLISFLFYKLNVKTVIGMLNQISIPVLFSVIALTLFASVLLALRLQIILISAQPVSRSFEALWKITNIGLFFNQTMPSSIGGDIVKIWLLKLSGVSIQDATSSVTLERLLGFIALGILLGMGFIFQWDLLKNALIIIPLMLSVIIVIISIMLIILIPIFPNRWLNFKLTSFINPYVKSMKETIQILYFNKINLFRLSAISIGLHLLHITIIRLICKSLGFDLLWIQCFVAIPLMFLVSSLPISVAGWGVREGISVATLTVFSIKEEFALAMSVTYGLLQILGSLPGLVYWISSKSKAIVPLETLTNK